MTDPHYYHTIEKSSVAEYRERGSRFIACAVPLLSKAGFKEHLQSIKSAHTKATHYCFAYRLGLDGSDFRTGDGGEPPGTAGRPILGQIDSRQLTNILVVVVRYFGGTLLGVPGLINAYKTATSLSLQVTPVIRRMVMISYHLEFDYTMLNDVMIALKHYQCSMIEQELQLFCTMKIGIPVIYLKEALKRLGDMPSVHMRTYPDVKY